MQELRAAFAHLSLRRAGARLKSLSFAPKLFAGDGLIGAVAASVIGHNAKPVRAVYFDKSDQANWSLDWHQDRVISVRERIEAPGFGPWTTKAGILHVVPPFNELARMVTLRVHLDDADIDNAPLLIAPGSHLLGRLEESRLKSVVEQCGVRACLAKRGDVWLYATPIIHASRASLTPSRRRVLQIDYAAFELPFGLRWHSLIEFPQERVADETD